MDNLQSELGIEQWDANLEKWSWRYWIADGNPVDLDESDPLKFALAGHGYNEAKDTRREIASWIAEDRLKGRAYYAEYDNRKRLGLPVFGTVVIFENDADATLFKLRWC